MSAQARIVFAPRGARSCDAGLNAYRPQWLFVRVGAECDTPQAMAEYWQAFDPRIVGLSGTEGQIAGASCSSRVYYWRAPLEGGSYTMDHWASDFLLDASGRFAGTIDHKETERVMLEKLRMLVGRGGSAGARYRG